jgi:DNA-directed RNA polymerase specialized sigma24 family protein
MTSTEALALSRLRQWAYERTAEQQSKTRNPEARGWCRRDERQFDARRVRTIDTEKALEALRPEQIVLLTYRYVYRETDEKTAQAVGYSVRKISYELPKARRMLARAMERLALI